MARIQVYEQRTRLTGQIQGGQISGQSPIANAAQDLSRTIVNVGNQLQQNERERALIAERQAEDRAAVDVANVLSKGDVYWQESYDTAASKWKPGDPDMREKLGQEFDTWVQETKEKLSTEKSRNFFERQAAPMKARLQMTAFKDQDRITTDAMVADTAVGMRADEDIVYRTPERLSEVKARRLATLESMAGVSQAKKIEIGKKYSQDLDYAVERGELARNPTEYLAKRRMPAADGTSQPVPASVPDDKLFAAVVHQESRGKHTTAGGQLLTSPAGAKGITQVMPATGTDPGYGVAPLKDQSEAEYLRFGKDYLGAMLREYNGDQAKALAAYNAGPGRVNDAVRKGGANWLASMPQETKDYVSKISKAAGGEAHASTPGAQVSTGTSEAKAGPSTFESLPFEQREALILAAENKLRQNNARYETEVNRKVSDATAMHVDGKMDPFNMTVQDFDRAYGADGPRRYAEYQSSRHMAADVAQFKVMTPDQINDSLKASKADVDALAAGKGEGYAAADQRQNVRLQAAATVVKEQQADPQAYAVKAGLAQSQPLDFNNTESFGAELSRRVGTAEMMTQRYKTPYRLMTDTETKQMVQVMNNFPTAAKVDFLNTIRRSVSDPSAYRSIVGQIAPDSPVTAVAGSILGKEASVNYGGGIIFNRGGTTITPTVAATTILQGESILNPPKDAKKQDGRGGNFPMPKDVDMEREFSDFVGVSFRGDAVGYSAALQAYRAYYAGKASQMGILSPDLDTNISKEALQAVTGGVIDYNSNGKVLKPWGMPDESFKNTVKLKFDEAMKSNGYTGTRMDNLDSYGLQSFREGQYLMTNGTNYLVGKNGQPIVIDTRSPNPAVTSRTRAVPLPPAVNGATQPTSASVDSTVDYTAMNGPAL